jgi:hypothetical protein
MSRYFLERAAYHLSLRSPLAERHPGDPGGALSELLELSRSDAIASLRAIDLRLELTDKEADIIRSGDVAQMYLQGVHPNIVRNFAGTYGIDYVARYQEAGLRDD